MSALRRRSNIPVECPRALLEQVGSIFIDLRGID